ncbi:amidase signature enzyme [Eremomyces bilateralis CBS 781.70]|uniref:Amidase signature enzyme n=1 Tax=Eremomyces bilateralis CBS 781.70 TaxID=1392243 RepID=A0A6G1G4B6_9PEZI|nr:amidase signature enzyme [Eremomyces bilateralis CBS 781.70]KAF1812756.1 amidase signature enzyme [Eremomyces bilateralis CBS 781.70]
MRFDCAVPNKMEFLTVDAKPYPYAFPLRKTALVIIDMQRDFLLPDGFGEIEGGDLTDVQAAIEPVGKLLAACRNAGMTVFHTREGQRPDMSDMPSNKTVRQAEAPDTQYKLGIGDKGKMGRLLIRGEYGHDIVDELQPVPGEVIIDKPGKGAFWDTQIMYRLKSRGITHLLIAGVTTECCVTTTYREANDRGFECCAVFEATDGYNPGFKISALDMLHWSQGLFGFVANLQPLLDVLKPLSITTPSSGPSPLKTIPEWDGDLRLASLQAAYRSGLPAVAVIEALYQKIEAYEKVNPGAWIHLLPKSDILAAAELCITRFPDRSKLPPLFGIPFTVKDSIDVAGLPTTTACPPLTRTPTISAPIYTKALESGALFLGKVNLDQLATGLTGCRSPYGLPSSAFHSDFIPGGSSSGSAVTVAAQLCTFSLATDTAGSGRVPAALNGVVGYKPTRGLLPFVGITPACLSLDCVALITQTVTDARAIWNVLEEYDPQDPYAKLPESRAVSRHINSTGKASKTFKFGIPPFEALECCSPPYRRMFNIAIARMQEIGGILTPIDWSPFEKAGRLLYDGSFVCERLASLPDDFFTKHADVLQPAIRELFGAVEGRKSTAVDAYRDLQERAALTRAAEIVFAEAAEGVDVVVCPTLPTHWTIKQVQESPLKRNTVNGTFTQCANVLDLCGISVPSGRLHASELRLEDVKEGMLPFGVMFLGGSRMDSEVLEITRRFEESIIVGK